MAEDIDFKLNFDDGGFLDSLRQMSTETEGFLDILRQMEKDGAEAFDKDAIKDYRAEMDRLGKELESTEKSTQEAARAMDEYSSEAKGALRNFSLFGVSIGDVSDKFKKLGGAMSASTKGIGGMAKGFKLLRVAIAATGIGAILVLVAGLTQALSRYQPVMDFAAKVTAGFGGAMDSIVTNGEKVKQLFISLVKVISGPVTAMIRFVEAVRDGDSVMQAMRKSAQGAFQDIKDVGSAARGLATDMVAAAKAGFSLEGELREIRRELMEWRVEEDALRATIAAQRAIASDRSKTEAQRASAQKEATAALNTLETKKLDLLQRQADVERRNFEASNKNDAARQQYLDSESAYQQGIRDVEMERRALIAQANQLYNEQLQKITQQQQVMRETMASLKRYLAELSGPDAVRLLDLDAEIANVEDFIAFLQRQGPAFSREIAALRERADAILLEQAERASRVRVLPLDALLPDAAQLEKTVLETSLIIEQAFDRIAKDLKDNYTPATSSRMSITDFFGDLAEGLEEARPVLEGVAGTLGDILTGSFTAQIQAADMAIASIQRVTSVLQQELDRERRIREEGYANDVELLEAKLIAETERLGEAERRREELARKAANVQLQIDSVMQASQLALAVAKLLSGSAGNPLAFIATATAGLGALFAIFNNFKQMASTVAAPPKFRLGGAVEGPLHAQGGVLAEVEGGEFVMRREAVATYGPELMEALNQGRFHDYLPSLVRTAEDSRVRLEGRRASLQARRQEAFLAAETDRLIDYWKSRPIDTPIGVSFMREYTHGTTKVRRLYNSEKKP